MNKFHIYLDDKGEYRWHLKSQNGNIVADSGEGYKQKAECRNGIKIVQSSWSCDVIDETREE